MNEANVAVQACDVTRHEGNQRRHKLANIRGSWRGEQTTEASDRGTRAHTLMDLGARTERHSSGREGATNEGRIRRGQQPTARGEDGFGSDD